jgi:hypothetical protein
MPTKLNEFEINIARYQRLSREVTDPLAISLLALVIGDLEKDFIGPRAQAPLATISLTVSGSESAGPLAVTG